MVFSNPQFMDFYNGLHCLVFFLYYFSSGPSRNWKIICGRGLSSPSFVHECTTKLWTHSGKRYIVDVLCEHKMFRRYSKQPIETVLTLMNSL